jgi:hypothetical protein
MKIKAKGKIWGIFLLAIGILVFASIVIRPLRVMEKKILTKIGLWNVIEDLKRMTGLVFEPRVYINLLPPDRVSLRRQLVTTLNRAIEREEFKQAAFLNAVLAQEAWQRAYLTIKAWDKWRDPATGLLPRAIHPREAYWNAKDTAADLFPFILLASHYLEPNSKDHWLKALRQESRICGRMPCSIHLDTAKIIAEDPAAIVLGAAEYAKDGLITLVEQLGDGPWLKRLEEIMGALIKLSGSESGGMISSSAEVNGELLQVLSRLYWKTRKLEYLHMAERIAEAYLLRVLPNNNALPVNHWDFLTGKPIDPNFRLRDHGSEIIAGLCELYFLEKILDRKQAQQYRQPLKKCLDRLLEIGRTPEGLWYTSVDTRTLKPYRTDPVDTWGYILNAYHTFDLAENTRLHSEEIKQGMRAVAKLKSHSWEGQYQDGYADTIESMLYLLAWFDIAECRRWVDDEIELLFSKQFPSGLVEGWYLDGNFIRTALLYAGYKTRGIRPHPWRQDIQLGTVFDPKIQTTYVFLDSASSWNGVLQFDHPRHRDIWHMPLNYPRLNAAPEWFVVTADHSCTITDINTGQKQVFSGQTLADGLPVQHKKNTPPLFFQISCNHQSG